MSCGNTPAGVRVELLPLLDMSQPTLSHHLKKLRDAGIVRVERCGLWAYYYVHRIDGGTSLGCPSRSRAHCQ